MRGDGVEYFTVGLVFVETVIDKVPKKSPALRAAPAVGVVNSSSLFPLFYSPPATGGDERGVSNRDQLRLIACLAVASGFGLPVASFIW